MPFSRLSHVLPQRRWPPLVPPPDSITDGDRATAITFRVTEHDEINSCSVARGRAWI